MLADDHEPIVWVNEEEIELAGLMGLDEDMNGEEDIDEDRPIVVTQRVIPDLNQPFPDDKKLANKHVGSTYGIEHALDTVCPFDDSQEGGPATNTEERLVVAERLRLLRYHYDVLTRRRHARQIIDQYIATEQCCPYCPLGAVTTVWPIFRNGKWCWDVNCIGTGFMSYHSHFATYHPAERAQIDAGVVPPFRSSVWKHESQVSDELIDDWHDVLNDCLKRDLGPAEVTISEEDIEWYQSLYLTDDFVSKPHRSSWVE